MTKTAFEVEQLKRDGFSLVKGLFDRGEVACVREEAKRIFLLQMAQQGIGPANASSESEFEEAIYRYFAKDSSGFVNCANQTQYLVSLSRLCTDERIISILRECGLEFPILNKAPTLYFNSRHLAKQEHYWRQREHQDWRFLQGSLDSLVVWVALVDIDRSLGALEVLPGSHKRGLLDSDLFEGYGLIKPELINEDDFVPMEVNAGDALIFSTFTVHRAGENITRSIRWSCHFRYTNMLERTFIERKFPHTYAYKPTERIVTEGFPSPQLLHDIFGPVNGR